MTIVLDLSKIKYVHDNERDIEIAAILQLAEEYRDELNSVLDVGAHWSWDSYAPQLRKILKDKTYIGIDLNPDPQTEAILNKYQVGNYLDWYHGVYFDLVFSISSLEHAGIIAVYPPTKDWKEEREKMIKKLVKNTHKLLFVTVPYGLPCHIPEQYANFTKEDLSLFAMQPGVGSLEKHFYFREGPGKPFQEITKQEADKIDYREEFGTRCVCFLLIKTKGGRI